MRLATICFRQVAERMQAAIRSVDTVSRVGGDEFVVLLGEIETAEDAARVAEKIIYHAVPTYHIEEHELSLTASIGICIYPDNGSDPASSFATPTLPCIPPRSRGATVTSSILKT